MAAVTRDENPDPMADPPDPVRITAHYRIRHNDGIPSKGLRDPGSLQSSLKSVIDALKKVPASSDKLKWRNGLYTEKGYIVDDGPLNVTYGEHSQQTVPTPASEELILTIEPVEELPIDTNPPLEENQ